MNTRELAELQRASANKQRECLTPPVSELSTKELEVEHFGLSLFYESPGNRSYDSWRQLVQRMEDVTQELERRGLHLTEHGWLPGNGLAIPPKQ